MKDSNVQEIDLQGNWQFRLDAEEEGYEENWGTEKWDFGEAKNIVLPGVLQEQGFGDPVNLETDWVSGLHDQLWYLREEYKYAQEDKVRVPFLSQPPSHYLGRAWYSTEFTVENDQDGFYGRFCIECSRWKIDVWLDGEHVGEDMTLCGPLGAELGQLKAGNHVLTVCIDNSMLLPYRPDGHGVSDALSATWNGMAGKICVELVPMVEIEEVRIFPDWENGCFLSRISVWNHTQEDIPALIKEKRSSSMPFLAHPGRQWVVVTSEGDIDRKQWDEFSPYLAEAEYMLETARGTQIRRESFGFRQIQTSQGRFLVNGRQTYFRGTHFGGDYPISGYPECGLLWWQDKMRIIRQWGLNFIRFHSCCPPEAAFQAADEAGIYLQVECSMWNVFHMDTQMKEIAFKEACRIIKAFGNHPSFVMLSPSNEPGGDWLKPLTWWVEKCREEDSRRIYTIQSGWNYPVPPHEITGTDYVYFHRSGYGIEPGGTIRNVPGWMGKDYRESLKGIKYPVICHELGQWCSYPDYDIIDKFTGYMEPGNFEVFKESLKAHGMEGMDKSFAFHSGKLQAQMYKEELEANFRTPHIYGFELLDLHDYLGQGTALVGVLDAFWQPKGYITPEQWREFCNETVLLARLPKRVFTDREEVRIPVEVSHFGREVPGKTILKWELAEAKGAIREGGSLQIRLETGKNQEAGEIHLNFQKIAEGETALGKIAEDKTAEGKIAGDKMAKGIFAAGQPVLPEKLCLKLSMEELHISNHWDIWLFPSVPSVMEKDKTVLKADGKNNACQKQQEMDILVTDNWEQMEKGLARGQRVLFCPAPGTLDYCCPPIPFRPAFWNSQMGPVWGRGMGMICENAHPVFRHFPTDSWGGWQWENILAGSRGLRMDRLPARLPLLVQPIDEWNRNWKLGLLFESRSGNGKLMMSGMDLIHMDLDRPAAWALRHSILEYMKSGEFRPEAEISVKELRQLYFPHYRLAQNPSGLVSGIETAYIFEEKNPDRILVQLSDGDGNTFCRLEGGHPYHIRMELGKEWITQGIYYLPRQNERNHEGEIREYAIQAFIEGSWKNIAEGELLSSYEGKRILFREPVRTSSLRLIVKSGFGGRNVRRYMEGREGWTSVRGEWTDTVFSAAVLDIISDEVVPEATNISARAENHVTSATREIDN